MSSVPKDSQTIPQFGQINNVAQMGRFHRCMPGSLLSCTKGPHGVQSILCLGLGEMRLISLELMVQPFSSRLQIVDFNFGF